MPPVRLKLREYELDLRTRELLHNGRRRLLQEQPYRVLRMLLERPGELVTREELQQGLWPADSVVDFEHGLNKAIGKLRDALGEHGQPSQLIETLPRQGYRFVGPVEPVFESGGKGTAASPSQEALPALSSSPEQMSAAAAVPIRTPAPSSSGWLIAAGCLGLALLVGAAAVLNVGGLRDAIFPRPSIRSVAVLPLKNLSGTPDQDYLAQGFTDELTTNLARFSTLRVVSSTSASRYHDPPGGLAQVARDLNVDAVVEGSVVRSGKRVRITAQLIDARTDTHLWAQSYEREFGEVLEIQDTIARDIASQLRATLTAAADKAQRRHSPIDPDAYDALLRGRNEQGKQRGSALLSSVRYFEKAIDLEPRYAAAFAGLADSYSLLANYGVLTPSVAFPRAEAAARKALELDPDSAEAHTALAYVKHHYEWDWAGAEAEYRRSFEINPQSPTTHLRYSEYLSNMGRHEEAIGEIRRAQSLAPLSLVIGSSVGRYLYYARRYDEAVAELQQLLALDPERAYARIHLAMAYEEKGDCARALAEMSRANMQFGGGPGPGLAHVYARCGKRDEARRMLASLESPPANGVYDWVWIAAVHAALGEPNEAFVWLERAYQERDFFLPFIRVVPYMDPLRGDPRFQAILKKMDGGQP